MFVGPKEFSRYETGLESGLTAAEQEFPEKEGRRLNWTLCFGCRSHLCVVCALFHCCVASLHLQVSVKESHTRPHKDTSRMCKS